MKNKVTIPSHPDEVIDSQYGPRTMRAWCLLECARLRSGGVAAEVVERNGKVWVVRP